MNVFAKFRIAFLFVGMLCGIIPMIAAPTETYITPVSDEILIAISSLVPSGQTPSEKDFNRAKDCGFNATFVKGNADDAATIIDDASESNLKLLIVNNTAKFENYKSKDYIPSLDNLVKAYSQYKNVVGYDLSDEPSWESLPDLKQRYDIFENVLKKNKSNQFLCINIVGVSTRHYSSKLTYPEYVNHIAEFFSPNQISMDFYPILQFPGQKKIEVRYQQFYLDLAALASMREKYGIPFWSHCMTMEHSNNEGYYQPRPTEGYLRFEAYSALAYGAQGLIHWSYSQRPSNASETYLSAPINLKGEKTNVWNRVRNVNREIRAYNPVFFNAVPLKCVHTGDVASKIQHKGYTAADAAKEILPEVKITSQKDGVLISHLKNGRKRYIVMANQNPFKSQRINFSLPEGYKYKEYTSSNGRLKISGLSAHKLSRRLKAGGILVLEYTK